MLTQKEFLEQEGKEGVEILKDAILKIRATGSTQKSISMESDEKSFTIFGRKYFSAIETGRGPRKTTEDQGFKDYMLDYMKARRIGANLSEKKREQLAEFLVLQINKNGDKTFQSGGREVYSKKMDKFLEGFNERFTDYFYGKIINTLKDATNKNK